jgi:hypothetical protein
MATLERRSAIALDDAYFYCRQLESGARRPDLFQVVNAIGTLDLALASQDESPMPVSICADAWSRVRDSLFNILLSSFSGYFIICPEGSTTPLESGEPWPDAGVIEFFPEFSQRKHDSYRASLDRVDPAVLTPIRWCFAEGRQTIDPSDFQNSSEQDEEPAPEAQDARELLARMYEVCEEEASEGKKKAHRRWWQLYWEANSCPNRREKHQLQKQMVALQSIWGKPSADRTGR